MKKKISNTIIIIKDLLNFFKVFIDIFREYSSSLFKNNIPKYKITGQGSIKIPKNFNYTSSNDFVIVIQGPIYGEFTIQTINFYKKIFPNIHIIVSTWVGLDCKILEKLKLLDIILIENEDVCHSYDNQNRMIASTYAGISAAIKNNPNSFLIKHRGDQRLTNINWLRNIEDLLFSFPARDLVGSKFRIGSISSCSGKLRPFMIGDQFQFGHITDMFELWSAPYLEIGLSQLFNYFNFDGYIKYGFGIKADNYLVGHYIKRNNLDFDFSLEDSNKFWAAKGIIIDADSVGFCWARKELNKKMELFYDCNPFNGSLSPNGGISKMNFSDWLHIYRTGKLSYSFFSPEIWAVKDVVNGMPFYDITSIGELKN